MAIIRYPSLGSNPIREMERLRREMDRLFSDAMGRAPAGSGVFPALNISEDAEKIYVQTELPGVRPEDIDISVVGNTLTLRGERKPDSVDNVSYHRRERRAGRFQKAITLPSDINADAVEARCSDGVLQLVLPKAEHAKPKKIDVKVS